MSLKSRITRCRRHLRSILLFIYFSLLGFALFNYKSHCVYTMPDALLQMSQIGHSSEGKCQVNLDELDEVKVDIFTEPTEEEIEARNPEVQKGGVWSPKNCQSWQQVAIIIPYRDRYPFLKILLNRILPMMQRQLLSFHVFVIEQAGDKQFNRGKLMNVGYMEALKFDKFDCFVFQDADLLPETDKNLYMCDPHARHLASAINEMRYHVMYYNYAGGVIALNRENYHRINGYSNSYWGWGNEDDDFSARIWESGLLLTRPPEHIGRYKMVRHKKQTRSDHGGPKSQPAQTLQENTWSHDLGVARTPLSVRKSRAETLVQRGLSSSEDLLWFRSPKEYQLTHPLRWVYPHNEMFLGWRSRWRTDGLSDPVGMNYTRIELQKRPLYTHIKVDIGDPPAKMRLGNPDELVSLWWFLKFYFP